ncbi:hypothetical protein [Corynebacterium cystitidis]|uniref:hypothetical protein n=1 Tax=Corynebacterium cystitidis TaxID=35757 RepID=UPI00211E97FD|nr:hypothetical protein [Corynebacterium cystitidis]
MAEMNVNLVHHNFELLVESLALLAWLIEEIASEGRGRVADLFVGLPDAARRTSEIVRYAEGES